MAMLIVDTKKTPSDELRRPGHEDFALQVKEIVRQAEDLRLKYMRSSRRRSFIATTFSILGVLAGAAGFGWYFLSKGDIKTGIFCVAVSVIPYFITSPWIHAPIRKYKNAHKSQFMPKLAQALGGFRYSADGGISEKIIVHTQIIPDYTRYDAEDCFIGRYKNMKVLFSEARLYNKKNLVFQGLFVLLELPKPSFAAQLILTSNKQMAHEWASTRWFKLSSVPAKSSTPEWDRFFGFSENPDEAKGMINDRLLKELSEASDVFSRAPLSVSFMKGKYVFVSIP